MRASLAAFLLGVTALAQVQPPPLFATPYLAAFPGSTFHLAVVVEITEGWAIPAVNVTLKGLMPTELFVEPPSGLTCLEVIYPKPDKKWLDFAKTYVEVYTGQAIFLVAIHVEEDASPGIHLISLRLTYQACEARLCLLPETLEFMMPILIVPKPLEQEGISFNPSESFRLAHFQIF
ncbi:MAG: protein-disulfide reductase DsbD domain-containing protein [Candidatus Bipolaricaulaceae bacterium]